MGTSPLSMMREEKASQELSKLEEAFGRVVSEFRLPPPPEQDEVDEGDWEIKVFATLDNFKSVCCS